MKNLPYDRSARIAEAVYEIVSLAVVSELSDPRLKGVEITKVRMTKDLRIVRVNFHLANATADGIKKATEGLESSKGALKRLIGEEVKLRFMPEIVFHYDESVDAEERIEELLKAVACR